jgi:hypothetical protein
MMGLIRLDPKTESLVKRMARRKRQTESMVIQEALMALIRAEREAEERASPYEAIAHLIGCVRGGLKDLSVRTGDKLHKVLLARARS